MTALTNPTKEYYPMPMELVEGQPEWLPIVVYPGVVEGYTVSIYGDARSPKGKMLKPSYQSGHLWVNLTNEKGSTTRLRLDRAILDAFVRPEPEMVPEHIDNDFRNCQLINLRWREPTPSERGVLKMGRKRRGVPLAKTQRKSRKTAAKTAPASKPDEVTVLRVYECNGMKVSVANAGEIVQMTPDPNRRGGLSPLQVRGLAKIMESVAEMDALMGRGKRL